MKKYIPWILLGAVFVGGVYLYATWRGDLKVVEEKIRSGKELAAAQAKQIEAQAAFTAKLEIAQAKNQAEAAARERWYQVNIVPKVAQATPQQLVDEGARILQATDITTDGKTVTMGVETWRGAVKIFLNEEEYRLQREPSWLRDKIGYEVIIASQKVEIGKHGERETGLEGTIADLSKALGIQKRMTVIQKALWGFGGFGLGKGLNVVANLLKGKQT